MSRRRRGGPDAWPRMKRRGVRRRRVRIASRVPFDALIEATLNAIYGRLISPPGHRTVLVRTPHGALPEPFVKSMEAADVFTLAAEVKSVAAEVDPLTTDTTTLDVIVVPPREDPNADEVDL